MLIPHTFDPLKHLYHVEKEYTLATSDIITMAGLNDMSQVPGKQKGLQGLHSRDSSPTKLPKPMNQRNPD